MAIMTFYICFWCDGYRLSRKTQIDSKMWAKWDNLDRNISQHIFICLCVLKYLTSVMYIMHICTYILFLLLNNLWFFLITCLNIWRGKGYLSWLIFSAIPELEQVLEGSFDSISFQSGLLGSSTPLIKHWGSNICQYLVSWGISGAIWWT